MDITLINLLTPLYEAFNHIQLFVNFVFMVLVAMPAWLNTLAHYNRELTYLPETTPQVREYRASRDRRRAMVFGKYRHINATTTVKDVAKKIDQEKRTKRRFILTAPTLVEATMQKAEPVVLKPAPVRRPRSLFRKLQYKKHTVQVVMPEFLGFLSDGVDRSDGKFQDKNGRWRNSSGKYITILMPR